MASEAKIEKALRLGVEALGGTCEKFTSPGKRFAPDRLITWPRTTPERLPLIEFVEVKAPNGTLESGQQRDHERRRAMGCNVYVLWTLEHVEEYLRARGKK